MSQSPYNRASFPAFIHVRRQCAMRKDSTTPRWTRHLFYRAEHTRTTWNLRLGLFALVVVALWLTSGWWTVAIGQSLVCDASLEPSDAILVDNLDQDYRLFERAAELRRVGLASRVLVPVLADAGTREPNSVALGTTEVMARIARVGEIEVLPILEAEPISLNAAREMQRFLDRGQIRSVIVVTPLFRSRRSALVYAATFGKAGVTVRCQPVQRSAGVSDWTLSWHGIEEVMQQWLKLQYYRFYVLPFGLARLGPIGDVP